MWGTEPVWTQPKPYVRNRCKRCAHGQRCTASSGYKAHARLAHAYTPPRSVRGRTVRAHRLGAAVSGRGALERRAARRRRACTGLTGRAASVQVLIGRRAWLVGVPVDARRKVVHHLHRPHTLPRQRAPAAIRVLSLPHARAVARAAGRGTCMRLIRTGQPYGDTERPVR
jgi:hypothetical protein